MLPRISRLPLRKEFPHLQALGRRFDSPLFGLTLRENTEREATGAQAAFIISKKVDSRSVVRHEVKRKFSEALYPLLPHLSLSLDLVFFVKKSAVLITQADLRAEMADILTKANLLTPSPTIKRREAVMKREEEVS